MEQFLTPASLKEAECRARRRSHLLGGLILLGGALLLLICLLTRTGNARFMLLAAWICLIPLGWGVLALWMFSVEPARAEQKHLEGLLEADREIREGRLYLTGDQFRIPHSVRVAKVRLETVEGTLSLNLNARLLHRLPPDGTFVRVEIIRKFVTGVDVPEAVPAGTESAPSANAGRRAAAVPARGRQFLQAFLRFLPAAFLWGMAALIAIGFIFTRITDTDPAHKIVIYADCEVQNAAALAERLEEKLSGAVRMVKIHPFSYALFGSSQILSADLYLVPNAHLSDYESWFAPLPGTPEEGYTVYDPENQIAIASDYFLYSSSDAQNSRWGLYFGTASVHREDGLAEKAAMLLINNEW